MVQPPWKTTGSSSKLNLELSYDPAISLLDIYPQELKTGTQRSTYTYLFTTALFTITNQKVNTVQMFNRWINKL